MSAQSIFNRIDSIPYSPALTPDEFCRIQPCVDVSVGGFQFTLIQPTSTAIVFALGLLWLAAGVFFWVTRRGQRSRLWWSVALFLGGIAAISAGASYQAFGYEIKCVGRELCTWTSWWEIIYQTLQVAAMDAMLIAVAYSSTAGKWRRLLIGYAGINALIHLAITAAGSMIPVKFLISFELLVLFSTPNLIIVFAISLWRFWKLRNKMDLALLGAGLWLVLTTGAYFAYFAAGITQQLWARGIWFSDNDVLHIGMIIWIIYLVITIGVLAQDHPGDGQQE